MLIPLLSPDNAPLTSLHLLRLQLARATGMLSAEIRAGTHELCVYPLLGTVRAATGSHTYALGERRDVRLPPTHVLRIPANWPLDIILEGEAADLFIAHAPGLCAPSPVLQIHGACVHTVGEGAHRREVVEVPTPPGYALHCGQTFNPPGHWSSWPSHATPEEVPRYAEHQEVFWIITPGYGVMRLDGRYATGELAQGLVEIPNNTALVTPLGSHEIVFSPGAWGLYVWFYSSFLEKKYNIWAHESTKTYQK